MISLLTYQELLASDLSDLPTPCLITDWDFDEDAMFYVGVDYKDNQDIHFFARLFLA